MKKIKIEPVKALGLLATVVGLAATGLSSYVEDKKTDAKIEEKVRKALAEKNGGTDED